MQTNKAKLVGVFLGLICFNALADSPVVSDVVVRQRWPWSRLVDIDYVLTCDPSEYVDIALTAHNGSEALNIPSEALSGDLNFVGPGSRRIILDPTKTEYVDGKIMKHVNVTLTPSLVPLYMVVDLIKSAGAPGQIEYVNSGDERLVTEGRYTNVWLDVTNDTVYATDKMVLRRINPGSYRMGPGADLDVTLTKSFYVGVFEVTQRQWEHIMGTRPSFFANNSYYAERPVEQISYNIIRGSIAEGVNWPATGAHVTDNSFIGKLRAATGLNAFDMPTDAQWEYACRAGTATVFNDNDPSATISDPYKNSNAWLNKLGRYRYNGGYLNPASTTNPEDGAGDYTTANGTARVGSYIPNAWGLYDMHGNVYEWAKDKGKTTPPGGVDPISDGTSADTRIKRGGSWHRSAYQCAAAERSWDGVNSTHHSFGLRIIIDLP